MTDPSMSAAEPPPAEDRGGAGTDLCQFVIFHCAEERFAAPLAQVKKIIRVPDMVRMPLSPAALLGLANLRGTVMPVLDLRHLSGLPAVLADEASRVVVLDHGHPVGLMVDRVANVVSVERGRLEAVDQLRAAVDGALLTGVIKDEAGGVVMVLDVATAWAAPSPRSRRASATRRCTATIIATTWHSPPTTPWWTRTNSSASRSTRRNMPSRSPRCRRSSSFRPRSPRYRACPRTCWG